MSDGTSGLNGSKKVGSKLFTSDENDGGGVILRKSRTKKLYSFTPTTTAGFHKQGTNSSVPKQLPLHNTKPQQTAPNSLPKIVRRTPRKRGNPDPNSDDHVFWELTPNTLGRDLKRSAAKKMAKRVPSSPIVDKRDGADLGDPLIPFLRKYNTTLDNLASQTPDSTKYRTNQRRSSDSEISDLMEKSDQISPSLQRNKSTGLENLKSEIFDSSMKPIKRLQITPFDSSTPASKTTTQHIKSKPVKSEKNINNLLEALGNSFKIPTSNSTTPLKVQENSVILESTSVINLDLELNSSSKAQANVQLVETVDLTDDFIEEGFSDDIDMSELDHLLTKKSQTATDFIDSNVGTLKKSVSDLEGFSSDEDMSDDGLDDLIIQLTQKPIAKKATTQELLNSDKNNAAIFQRELQKQDSSEFAKRHRAETQNLAKSAINKENFHRFQILEVMSCEYTKNNRKLNQKIVTVIGPDELTQKIIVRDLWETLDLQPNDVIHIVGTNPRIVDNQNNMLIWNPDIMLSATAVGEALVCERKAVLNSKLAFPGETSIPLIVGIIVHTLFQECLSKGNSTIDFIAELMEEQLQLNLIGILSINETKERVKDEVLKHVPYIQQWMSNSIADHPKFAIPSQNSKTKSMIGISNTLDVEEYIWSPMYGIRGLIDVTVETCIKDSKFDGRFVTPLEIKTGARENLLHRAQTSLYTLLIKERYGIDSEFFLLLYSKLKEMRKHEINLVDLKLLINIRNRISLFLREKRRELPPLLRQSKCDGCFALEACMTVNNLMENGTAEDSGLKEGLYESITREIDGNEKYQKFFNYWDDLITKEESVINALKKELWTKNASEREANGGKAIGGLKITESLEETSGFLYTLERSSVNTHETQSLQNSQLAKNDRVIISDENGHFALSSGWVVNIRPSFLTVRTDRRIINSFVKLPGFNEANNQRFQSVLHSSSESQEFVMTQSKMRTYRVDKDEMFHGLALARYNLLNLFLPQVGDSLRRKILVDLKKPRFALESLPYKIPENVQFNSDQINAFDKVLKTEDFSLILGMPGTGKTTVIAQIIRFLVQNQKSVLLASYTHSAVDNILIKLIDDDLPILRTGYPSRVHPLARKYVPNSGVEGSIEILGPSDFTKAYIDAQVVATTCLGINDVVFNHRKNFDYCIIDEASQVSMPVCLGPLRFCNKFILVGDHYQLPPLVISPEAKQGGLDKSLFMTLSDNFAESVVDLSYQYRMCADIMLLSNTLIYQGRLKCGTEAVANQRLHIPFPEKLDTLWKGSGEQWMTPILDPSNRVLFLDHDSVPALERTVGEKVENVTEAELVRQVVQALIFCGVDEKSIGVMSLYRAQLRLLHRKLSVCKNVEILTADQFQGRDKDCVVISMVRSNDRNSVGDLLKEWRRINVAITRARSKLIILGSRNTMKSLKTLDAFMSIIESRGWMYNLPERADQLYNVFLEGDTQSPTRIRKSVTLNSRLVQKTVVAKNIVDELL